ncbi:MAG: hypothetical protein Q9217_000844 [Psora testacea]
MERPEELLSAFDSETFGKDGSFHLDKPVGSASISPCGRDVVLASRQGLHIIDLDSPYAPPRHLAHHTPWEVADVQWSPFAARDYWVVSTSNQKALVWNLSMVSGQSSVEHVLHGHKRAITDINFSAHHPDILATCAVDSYVHCWDIRCPAKPAITFCDWFAGATQVKWNRQDSHILASSHDRNLKVWDDRKGAHPLKSIAAHSTKIYGVDWDRLDNKSVATCSLDKTIKIWDLNNENDVPHKVIHTPFPVWRARHTPFGSGLIALPQRGDHDLHLYDRRVNAGGQGNVSAKSTHQFSGHRDQVKEFLWRPRGTVNSTVDDRDFQLVSWGTDKLLRLHEVSEEVLGKVGYQKGMQVKRTLNFTRRGATYKTFRDEPAKQGEEGLDDTRSRSSALTRRSVLPAGISRGSMPFASGYGSEGFMSSVVDKTASVKEMDPVSWMRGVKIGKRAASPSAVPQSIGSILPPGLRATRAWDVFESLGEEITASLDKFPRIKIEDIDVQRRRLTVSISGPWAPEKASTPLKCRFEFPTAYPKAAAPSLTLERRSALSDEAASKFTKEATELANGFLSRQRNSLEAILRYLLGEQSLEESLEWLKKNKDGPDSDIDQPLSSSSDDDDEILGKYGGPQDDGLAFSDPMIGVNNAQYNVPLPNGCGASWAQNGRLVCFFPVKQEKETSLLGQSQAGNTRLQKAANDLFEGFGRLQRITYRQQRATSILSTITSSGSGDEESELSSSESSSPSDALGLPSRHFMPTMPWNGPAADVHEDFTLDVSQRSVGETGQPSTAASKANVLVAIHDLSALLPVKECLARQYLYSADHPAAIHNAHVAEDNGFQDLADAWTFAGLILQDNVPIESHSNLSAEESVSVMIRQVLSPLRDTDSAVDFSFDFREEGLQSKQRQPVQWAGHPFGRRWLVDALFRHFELQADIQMLAMLACVFVEPSRVSHLTQNNRTVAYHDIDLSPMLKRNCPRQYYASGEVARSLNKARGPELSVQIDSQRVSSGPHSATFLTDAAGRGPSASLFESATLPFYKSTRNNDRKNTHATSLSTSPEQHRQNHRAGSNLSAFAASFPRPFQNSHSAASSPPNAHPKKRASPTESYLSPTQSSIAWAPSSWIHRGSKILEDAKSTLSVSISDTEDDLPTTTPTTAAKPSLSLTLKNQDQFHGHGRASMPLLDPNQELKYKAWRGAYAQYLDIWDMPVAMAEVLKYNQNVPRSSSDQSFNINEPSHKGRLQDHPETTTLALAIHCTTCSAILFPHDEPTSNKCLSCRRLGRLPICIYCNTFIFGLSSPCLRCGHTMHFACRTEVTSSGLFDECITGCGCVCSEHETIDMPMPESQQPVQAGNMSIGRDNSPGITVVGDQPDTLLAEEQEQTRWDDVAYVSLSRNLKRKRRESGRTLRAMGSHVWRGT